MLTDKIHGAFSLSEFFVINHIFEERNVCIYPAYAEFQQCAMHPLRSVGQGSSRCGDFNKHGIKKWGDLHTWVGASFINPYPIPAGVSVGNQGSIIRFKIIS